LTATITRNLQQNTCNPKMPKEKRNYVLKPGQHQFIPRGHLITQEATTDAELAWYLEQMPHIAPLFSKINGKRVNQTKR
jgi:hypothetical protein